MSSSVYVHGSTIKGSPVGRTIWADDFDDASGTGLSQRPANGPDGQFNWFHSEIENPVGSDIYYVIGSGNLSAARSGTGSGSGMYLPQGINITGTPDIFVEGEWAMTPYSEIQGPSFGLVPNGSTMIGAWTMGVISTGSGGLRLGRWNSDTQAATFDQFNSPAAGRTIRMELTDNGTTITWYPRYDTEPAVFRQFTGQVAPAAFNVGFGYRFFNLSIGGQFWNWWRGGLM